MQNLFSENGNRMNDQSNQEFAAFILRLALGTMYLSHGVFAYIVLTPEGTAGFFESIGLPRLLAYATIAAEIIAGVMLLIGLYSKQVAWGMITVLLGSIVFVHGANGWVFSNENGGWEYPAFMIAASIAMGFIRDELFTVHSIIATKKTE